MLPSQTGFNFFRMACDPKEIGFNFLGSDAMTMWRTAFVACNPSSLPACSVVITWENVETSSRILNRYLFLACNATPKPRYVMTPQPETHICTFYLHLCYPRKLGAITAFPLSRHHHIIEWLPTPFYTYGTVRIHLTTPART